MKLYQLCFLLLLGTFVSAQKNMSLSDSIQEGLTNSYQIRLAKADLAVTEDNVNDALTGKLPTISPGLNPGISYRSSSAPPWPPPWTATKTSARSSISPADSLTTPSKTSASPRNASRAEPSTVSTTAPSR
jgi:outer membrane protein TolC